MKGETVFYDGRIVPTEGFRTFIYDIDGNQKLVNSWTEYLHHISMGIWFPKKGDIKTVEQDKPIRKKRGS